MINIKKVLFGTNTSRKLKAYNLLTEKVNALGPKLDGLSDGQILTKTEDIRKRCHQGEPLVDLLPEVFNYVRMAAVRTLEQRHFDVQILGGIALDDCQIAEMKTGEGKTLTSTLPMALNALTGKGVHLVTVNDYLAKRDKEWMAPVFEFLGLSVGLIQHGIDDAARKEAYKCDITYGTNSEFGFDYLRDNMKFKPENLVNPRDYFYAIIDEVDSILIDEARTPLIISGASDESTDKYRKIDTCLFALTRGFRLSDNPDLERAGKIHEVAPEKIGEFLQNFKDSDIIIDGDYVLDEKSRNIQLTETGAQKIESRLGALLKTDSLYDFENMEIYHHVNQGLTARYVFNKDIDYVVRENKVVIVDEFTGRLMEGRRYSDGLHQALEAKENLAIERENQTLATVTYQNFFRKYEKLSGMTGTAETEEEEFIKIYSLGVFVVPTHRPIIRKDMPDAIYKTKTAKNTAIVAKISELHEKGQPVLVGTDSIEYSEYLSKLLKQKKVPHNVLNAKYFEQEAQIIADAGRFKSVTIATNMAGRGTDIKLNEESRNAGGLYILGTVRHESRRIDNQLRGRSGRQGDPGESKYFISLEDDLLRIFGGERIAKIMTTMKLDENEAIEHPLISRAIENSQKNVESRNFSIRKHLLEYDDVINRQREIIYTKRKKILSETLNDELLDLSESVTDASIKRFCSSKNTEEWDLDSLAKELTDNFSTDAFDFSGADRLETVTARARDVIRALFEKKRTEIGDVAPLIEKHLLLDILDNNWKEHLVNLDYLRETVGLSGYAQKNPLDEYKKEAFYMFAELIDNIETASVRFFYRIRIRHDDTFVREKKFSDKNLRYASNETPADQSEQRKAMPLRKSPSQKRNDLCHCGSGKKYKNCCLKK